MSDNRPAVTYALLEEWDTTYPGDTVRGYLDGFNGAPWPDRDPSPAYEHGRRNGVNDKAGISEPDQRALAREYLAGGRARKAAARR